MLILLILSFCGWAFIDLILWATEKIDLIMFLWSILIFFDFLVYSLSFYFIYYFLRKEDLSFFKKGIIIFLLLPIVILVPTQLNLLYFDMTNCEREALEGLLWYYMYFLEGVFIFWIFYEGILALFKSKARERGRIISIVAGIVIFLILFSWGNIVGSLSSDWSIGQYGLFGLPVFAGFLGYAIIKYQVLNIRVLSVQLLIFALAIIVGAQFFFIRTSINRTLTAIALFFVFVFGFILIRTMKRELQRKEELQNLADQLAVANQKLKSLDRAKSEFISIASHQLRTPLTAIKGFISLILEGSYGNIDGSIRSALNKVYLSNERLIRLVEDLLSISRIESGRLEYKFRRWKIEELVEDIADMFRLRARDAGLDFQVIAPEKPLEEVYIDGDKIREVISNLIDNAIKYTKKGFVQVSISQKDNEYIRVIVKDSGVGVLAGDIPHLFEKFSRGKDTDRLHANGTGLGLYVGKQIMEAHGGKIHIFSEGENKGSTFILELSLENGDAREKKDTLSQKEKEEKI
ncbi:MAG: sensor histidine kinase [Candidatus Moranbacteria bacterium]|nr:sensor histidine kinase [Candidatus Moranbacteria bacterium]